jgi:hypothetical protein
MTKSKAAAFLANMTSDQVEPASTVAREKQDQVKGRKAAGTRIGLKHIGGYLAPDIVEKVAVLRARLRLDNSELITLAINELHNRQKAKRAFNEQ